MNDTAAFEAVYVGFRPMKTQPVVKIELEVPIEKAQAVIDALGWPRPGETTWVAVARLVDGQNNG